MLTYGSDLLSYVKGASEEWGPENNSIGNSWVCLSFCVFYVVIHCLILTTDEKFKFHLFCGMIGIKFKVKQ